MKYDSEQKSQVGFLGSTELSHGESIESLAMNIQNAGAGELIINNIDLEGTRKGFDISLMKKLNEQLSIPLVALGGASNIKDIEELLLATPINGIACGTLFVYGNNSQDVLLNYVQTAKWLQSNFNLLMKKFI